MKYKEQDPEKVEEYLKKINWIPEINRVYVDESGINTCLFNEYAYAPRGEKVFAKVFGKKFKRTNIIAAKKGNKILAPMQYNGTTDADLFEGWFEQILLPCLDDGDIVIMDNASFHRKERLFSIAKKYGKFIVFLPPYSPDLNPIEKFWANLKQFIKRKIDSFVSLDDAISAAFLHFSP